jgi:hypothetical protein
VVSTFKVSTLTTTESILQESTHVESEVLVLLEEPLPHDDNTTATHKAKINFFIFVFLFNCYLLVIGPRPVINITYSTNILIFTLIVKLFKILKAII